MISAQARLRAGAGVSFCACILGLACGSRTGVEACATGLEQCAVSAGAGQSAIPIAGAPALGGQHAAPSAGAAAGGRAGAGGTPQGGRAAGGGGAGGAAGSAGQGGTAGAPVREPPTVLLLMDASTSMFDMQVWAPTYEALLGPAGPIEEYQDRVRFGFASYRGTARTSEDDPACAEIKTVPFSVGNHASIRDAYGALDASRRRRPYETPTGHALDRVIEVLRAEPENAIKHIVLISDGAPDTCATGDPQCGQDRAVFAVQRAFELGIVTHAIGIGFGDYYPGCTPDTARCGSDHFQDVANAGVGLPVQAPPEPYVTLSCALETGGMLLARYSNPGGNARYHWTMGPAEVAAAVREVLIQITR